MHFYKNFDKPILGSDGIKLDWIKIGVLDKSKKRMVITCFFSDWLDDTNSYLGENCKAEHKEEPEWLFTGAAEFCDGRFYPCDDDGYIQSLIT